MAKAAENVRPESSSSVEQWPLFPTHVCALVHRSTETEWSRNRIICGYMCAVSSTTAHRSYSIRTAQGRVRKAHTMPMCLSTVKFLGFAFSSYSGDATIFSTPNTIPSLHDSPMAVLRGRMMGKGQTRPKIR